MHSQRIRPAGTYQLEHVPVLEETLLGNVRLLQFDAKVQVFEHDWLNHRFRPSVREFLVAEHLLESVQGSSRFSDIDEFCKTFFSLKIICGDLEF